MSIQKITIQEPATTREMNESVTCDLCGKIMRYAGVHVDGPVEWAGGYEVKQTCVSIGDGCSYPECTHIEYRCYHICPECFKIKLEPWLMAQGAQPTPGEIDY